MPVYAVLGNHDHMGDINAPYGIFKTTPIIPLVNQSVTLGGLQIVGIDDKSVWGDKTLEQLLEESDIQDNAQYTILLSHQPQKLSKLRDYPINLKLAGHTHKGQIIPFSWLVSFFNDYTYGRYDEEGKTAFVSQGIGGWGGPLRMGTQSEMVVITLNP